MSTDIYLSDIIVRIREREIDTLLVISKIYMFSEKGKYIYLRCMNHKIEYFRTSRVASCMHYTKYCKKQTEKTYCF